MNSSWITPVRRSPRHGTAFSLPTGDVVDDPSQAGGHRVPQVIEDASVFPRLTLRAEGGVVVAAMDGGPLGLLDADLVDDLARFVQRVDRDPDVRAVVLTGAHRQRFVSHADIAMLQHGGTLIPSMRRSTAAFLDTVATAAQKTPVLRGLLGRTPLAGVLRLNRFHHTLLRMNSSGVVYVAALNGSALGGGAELAWACDIRVMAQEDQYFLGQPEVLLGFNPGGGGTQRLTRLIGTHPALIRIVEGRPFTAQEALTIGAVDVVAPQDEVVTLAVSWGRRFGARPKEAIMASKRAVYFGASRGLADGLHVERAEFLRALATPRAQSIMRTYLRATKSTGELPLYTPTDYDEALSRGELPADG